MNTFIAFSGSKHMGNDISLIILVISENFQDDGSAAILDWPDPAPRGSEKLGHPSRVKDKGLMMWYAKFQRFFTKCSIVVFDDIFQSS